MYNALWAAWVSAVFFIAIAFMGWGLVYVPIPNKGKAVLYPAVLLAGAIGFWFGWGHA